jgi:hypothetical protein
MAKALISCVCEIHEGLTGDYKNNECYDRAPIFNLLGVQINWGLDCRHLDRTRVVVSSDASLEVGSRHWQTSFFCAATRDLRPYILRLSMVWLGLMSFAKQVHAYLA